MRKHEQSFAKRFDEALTAFIGDEHDLPGIGKPAFRAALIEQLVESVRRVKYPSVIRIQEHSQRRRDPADEMFDPLKAALLYFREGAIDEAYWLVFLFVQFGKHKEGGYLYARSVYGRLGQVGRWDWKSTSSDPDGFRTWLHANQEQLRALPTAFGNHRKRESLNAYSDNGTGATVATYISWVAPPRSHQ